MGDEMDLLEDLFKLEDEIKKEQSWLYLNSNHVRGIGTHIELLRMNTSYFAGMEGDSIPDEIVKSLDGLENAFARLCDIDDRAHEIINDKLNSIKKINKTFIEG